MNTITTARFPSFRDAVAFSAWVQLTDNGAGMSHAEVAATLKRAKIAANDAWEDEMNQDAWLAATIKALSA